MEKLMQRENGFPVYDGPEGLPKSSYRSSGDLDFEDVFGGPPRRFSMQEVKERYSFGESVELEEEGASSGWTEKPVFGKESVQQRRRHQGHDFFDDIFKGGESCTSPRRTDNNTFGSNPASRIMSPVRTGPKSDPFATSLPAQFSLPAKLTKGMELPTFASRSTNGLNTSHSSTSLSRFSNQATRSQGEIINEVPPIYRHSTLSREASFSSEDSPSTVTSDRKYSFENLKKDTKSEDSVANHFHFSIYKWAGRGVPMLMTLVAGNNSKSKVNSEYYTSASTNERMESESSTVRNPLESLKMEHKKEHWWSKEETNKLQSSTEEAFYRIPEPEFLGTPNVSVVLDETRQNIKEQVKSLDKTDTREKIEKEVPLNIDDSLKYEVKHLHAVLSDEVELPGSITKMKETKSRTPKEVDANAHDSKNMKKNEGTGIDSRNAMRSAATNSKAPPRKSAVKGKIREFVQIFNQETDSTHKADVRRRSQSSRWKNIGIEPKENEVSSDVAKSKENDNVYNVDKKADVSLKVNENLSNNETVQISPTKTPRHTRNCSVNLKKSFSSETLHWDSKISVENSDDFLEDNFMVEELSEDHEEVTQSESSEDTKAIDAKIRQWSVPKKGNIRSLLSTLQYVLWPESGWKAVPLVDLIEANSVKRAYQKALLRLHPDKLQQKGAAFHQKYTAEKVFDILQEAWDHFNTCSSLNV